MATYVFQKQQMISGDVRISDELVIPEGLTTARVEIDMNANEMRDPSTHVKATIQWHDQTLGDWRGLGFTILRGNPENSVQEMPYIQISPDTLNFLVGKRIRAVITALSDGNYGATATFS